MQRRLALAAAVVLLATGASVLAEDRPVTDDERAKLTAAVAAEGCSGGKMEFDIDENKFEVDDVTCRDGRKFELQFDTSFKLIVKKLDD
jgi:hypothetical protein